MITKEQTKALEKLNKTLKRCELCISVGLKLCNKEFESFTKEEKKYFIENIYKPAMKNG